MKQTKKITISLIASALLVNNIYAKDIKSLDTMTVTAQKTEENIQKVPISMSVFDEYSLQDKMIENISDVAKFTPGLEIINYGSSIKHAPSMRGLYDDFIRNNSVVGLFVDGVPITDGTGFDETLLDIERVEVLKGPQGTLYGKNTQVGAIIVITKKPNNETRGKILATLGSDDKKELAFSASGPIVKDKFYIGVSGKHFEKDGTALKHIHTGKMTDNREHNYGKINLRWTPTDKLEASFMTSKIKYNDGNNKASSIGKNVSSNLDAFNKSEIMLNALNISYAVSDKLSLTSITTHRKYNEKFHIDFDNTDNLAKKFHVITNASYKTISQEFRANYKNKNTKIIAGIFLEKGDNHLDRDISAFWGGRHILNDTESSTLGLFSHITYKLNDKLSVLGGLRYDKVNQNYKDTRKDIDNNENEISPKIGLTYDIQKNIMTYATISKGYKTGGFNVFAPADQSNIYGKETLYSYEIGIKGSAMDDRLTYDTALYYMDIKDMQADVYVSQVVSIRDNAAKATSQGIEASLNFQATDTINLFGGFSYNDTTFDKYNNGKKDLSGNRTAYAPKYNFNLGVLYRAMNGYYASANMTGFGDMYMDIDNKYKRDAYELVNTKIGYETEDYDIYFYAKNLFDKEYNRITRGTTYSEPRETGIKLAYRF